MAPLTHHTAVITVDNVVTEFYLLQPDQYGAINAETGIAKSATQDIDQPVVAVKELLAKGVLIRVAVSYLEGGVRKVGRILVTRQKLDTALAALKGKTFSGGTITSARVPRRRFLR